MAKGCFDDSKIEKLQIRIKKLEEGKLQFRRRLGGIMTSQDEEEEWNRKDVFHTRCTSKGKFCKMIIESGCYENLVLIEMVQKLVLEIVPHPNPYQVCGLRKGVVIEVSKQCLVSFSIGKTYKDEV